MKAVFDTNILIDYLNGVENAATELELYDEKMISIITFIEVMVGATDPEEEAVIRGFLESFTILDLSTDTAGEAVRLRQKYGLKVPDAMVYASAKVEGTFIVSRNTKDLKAEWPDVRIPYKI